MKIDNKTLTVALIVIIVLLLFGGSGFGMMGGYYGISWIFNILILILIIVGAYWLIKKINRNEGW